MLTPVVVKRQTGLRPFSVPLAPIVAAALAAIWRALVAVPPGQRSRQSWRGLVAPPT